MSDESICFMNCPVVVRVAKIVSPADTSLFWNSIEGIAETIESRKIARKINVPLFIV